MFRQNNQFFNNRVPMSYSNSIPTEERAGFLGPFLLGGLTGGLVAPFFYGGGYGNNFNQPPYYTNNYYYPPYPYYGYGPY